MSDVVAQFLTKLEAGLAIAIGMLTHFTEWDWVGYVAVLVKLYGATTMSWEAILVILIVRPTLIGLLVMLHQPLFDEMYDDDDDDDPPAPLRPRFGT